MFTEIHWNEAEKSWQVQLFDAEGNAIGEPSYTGPTLSWAQAVGEQILKGAMRHG